MQSEKKDASGTPKPTHVQEPEAIRIQSRIKAGFYLGMNVSAGLGHAPKTLIDAEIGT